MQKVQNMESVDIQSDVKQNAKKEQIHPVCLHAIEKYKKVESVNTQNDYKTCKRWTDRKKTNLFCEFRKSA